MFGQNDKLFINRVYNKGLYKYIDRLKAINFFGFEKVLDAGCGFGQWSLSLAYLNKSVEAFDVSNNRVEFLSNLAKSLGFDSLDVREASLEKIIYSDNNFDAVFCYGAIFCTSWHKSLGELYRVLKPGGSIYLTANDVGWYIYLWLSEHNKTTDYDPKEVVASAFSNTLNYSRFCGNIKGDQIIISKKEIKKVMKSLGFENIIVKDEGKIHLNSNSPIPTPFFKGKYYGLPGTFEVIAKKI